MAPSRLYHESLYRFAEAQPSYWEDTAGPRDLAASPLGAEESADVAIIGGGFTGLSAALHLARDFGVDVRVLEAGHIGWGASGRNGGFCGPGGVKLSMKKQIADYGIEEVRRYYQAQVEAIELVRALGQDEGIDFQAPEGSEIYAAEDGVVSEVRLDGDSDPLNKPYGNQVRIQHAGSYLTIYAHLSHVVVSKGQSVKAGQLIGLSGNTGNSFGAHLHLTLKKDGATRAGETNYPYDIVDPSPYLQPFSGGQFQGTY